jgi:flagellar motor protein MotB
MSTPIDINPKAMPKRPRRAVEPQLVPAAELTVNQLRVAHLFASMSDEAQEGVLPMIEAIARELPRRVRPALRLVGGAK